MFEELFQRKRLIDDKLIPFGFKKDKRGYRYVSDIKEGQFELTVIIAKDGAVDTKLIEKDTGEPYVLYKTNATGKYVGEIRTAVSKVLERISAECYETAVFKTKQAEMVIAYVRKKYRDEPEFLWTKFPDNAVWRRKDNEKWYGAILTVVGRKIGLDTDKIVEIIDLRMKPDDKDDILSRKHYYPGWHMNKKSWYTIVLNGSVPDKEIKTRIDESYNLAK